ncbi:MAG: hypothetical protein HY820_31515 [Acidobacteria bacterium]|nr:hypothetical protein [Acidobacteriota bacterium]
MAAEPSQESIVVDGRTRTYLLYSPPARPSRLPLVLVLQGSGGDAARMVRASAFHTLGAILVVYPNGYQKKWNDGRNIPSWLAHRENVDDIKFLSALIDSMVTKHNADPARVYITGISNGGLMSHRAGCELSDKVAAIAPVVRTITTRLAASAEIPYKRFARPAMFTIPLQPFHHRRNPLQPFCIRGRKISGKQHRHGGAPVPQPVAIA